MTVEVAVLGSMSLIVRAVSVDVKQHSTRSGAFLLDFECDVGGDLLFERL